jgi:hypothetical protein
MKIQTQYNRFSSRFRTYIVTCLQFLLKTLLREEYLHSVLFKETVSREMC